VQDSATQRIEDRGKAVKRNEQRNALTDDVKGITQRNANATQRGQQQQQQQLQQTEEE